ncbi:right-handed parallel beta-helix repeat-containing protein [Cohnella algarum]|uniref:right-handed parallel beta-helix repeat-containing protein n=1 Tax=Cohnella algarum TaxID=2044859 RepID=UPI0019684088|nr:right-handed parallel beta-helix repeat-containing protein [Cohnella algarum]MBN2983539.1 right-handed parallel beta-helix repeat-containing protein [Cohnella algarum]
MDRTANMGLPQLDQNDPWSVEDFNNSLMQLDKEIAHRGINLNWYGLSSDNADNLPHILRAIDENPPGTTFITPYSPAPYKIKGTIKPKSGMKFLSTEGAVFDSSEFNGDLFLIDNVDGVEISGVTFIGPATPGYSRAITISGTSKRCKVKDNEFRNYYGGAVFVNASRNYILHNDFYTVNNKPTPSEADFGTIHISGDRNVMIGNIIRDNDYSGISLYKASYNIVQSNEIVCKDGFGPGQMGIYILSGCSYNDISHNVVKNSGNEGIILNSNDNYGPIEHNIVSNNILVNCLYAGISLEKGGSYGVNYNIVEANQIASFSVPIPTTDTSHGIRVNGANHNLIKGNIIRSDRSRLLVGIRIENGAIANNIEGNQIIGAARGIAVTGEDVHVQNNHLYDSFELSMRISYARNGIIENNTIKNSGLGGSIAMGNDLHGCVIRNNKLDRMPYDEVGAVGVRAMLHSNQIHTITYQGTATLVSGMAAVSTVAINPDNSIGEIQLSYLAPAGVAANRGALFIDGVFKESSQFVIRSTNPNDASTVAWRIIR